MIKEIKFTDKALKQITNLLSKKDKGSFFTPDFSIIIFILKLSDKLKFLILIESGLLCQD